MLLVVVDTLRADRMSLYGYGRPTTPHLERFVAERGVFFRHALSNAGCTFPSVNSLLTSRSPQRFGRRPFGMGIPPDLPTLAERLRAAGYATAAVSTSVIVRRTPSKINTKGGFDAGFDLFDESCEERSGACVNERAQAALADLAEPYFLYLHYLDPHSPYRPPAWFERKFAPRRPGIRRWVADGEPKRLIRRLYEPESAEGAPPTDEEVAHLRDLYDEEIRFVDERLGELLRGLADRGTLDRTIVVLASDHGEELLDHGHWGHCRDLAYPTLLETPLVIAAAGVGGRGERASPVTNLDIAPTILDLVGVPFEAAALEGQSLRTLLSAGQAATRIAGRTVFAAQGSSRVAWNGDGFLRWDARTGASAFEPSRGPEADARLLRNLLAWMRAIEGETTPRERLEAADEQARELRALGYL